jgi:hypothetical protein
MKTLIAELCSKECAGRAPDTEGGRRAQQLITQAFSEAGLSVERQSVPGSKGVNLLARIETGAERWIIAAAHFDHLGTRGGEIFAGADDNAAAVAVLIEVARGLKASPPKGRNVLLAAFDAEEPPFFLSPAMGSVHFCAEPPVALEKVDFMVCMDLVGHAIGPQGLPDHVGKSLLFLGAEKSEGTGARVDALSVPGLFVRRADAEVIPPLSDYWAFWQRRVPFALMTCGRWAHYHTPQDTPEKLDYEKIAATARWLELFVRDACARPEPRVVYTGARDDASTLRSLIAVLDGIELAAPILARAQQLLARCDVKGLSPEPSAVTALVHQIEAMLA